MFMLEDKYSDYFLLANIKWQYTYFLSDIIFNDVSNHNLRKSCDDIFDGPNKASIYSNRVFYLYNDSNQKKLQFLSQKYLLVLSANESDFYLHPLIYIEMLLKKTIFKKTSLLNRNNADLCTKKRDESISKVRSMVKSIKKLRVATQERDIFLWLIKELSGFSKIRTPIFIYNHSESSQRVIYVQKEQVTNREIINFKAHGAHLKFNEKEDSIYFAEELKRPFSKLIKIPLNSLKSTQNYPPISVSSWLFFEHYFEDDEILTFIEEAKPIIDLFSMAMEQALFKIYLTKTSEFWEKTFDNVKDPIAIVDDEYRVLRSNRLFKKNKQKSLCYEVFFQRQSPCENCEKNISEFIKDSSMKVINSKDKEFEVFFYPIYFYEQEKPRATVNYYRERTSSNELRERVIQSEKMSALGHLAGNIAHELNNPLSGIRSLCQVLLMDISPEKQIFNDLNEVEKASERCQLIINNLLDYSSESEEKKNDKISVSRMILKTLPMLKTAMRYLNCEVTLDEGNDYIYFPGQMFQQVIFNLVNNACQALERKGHIQIQTRITNQKIIIRVKDDGPGISKEIIDKIFLPFFTTKAPGEGTGLGLSLVKQIVEKYSGLIEVKSEKEKGSEFTLKFPLVEK